MDEAPDSHPQRSVQLAVQYDVAKVTRLPGVGRVKSVLDYLSTDTTCGLEREAPHQGRQRLAAAGSRRLEARHGDRRRQALALLAFTLREGVAGEGVALALASFDDLHYSPLHEAVHGVHDGEIPNGREDDPAHVVGFEGLRSEDGLRDRALGADLHSVLEVAVLALKLQHLPDLHCHALGEEFVLQRQGLHLGGKRAVVGDGHLLLPHTGRNRPERNARLLAPAGFLLFLLLLLCRR
mmetsp:Transcript_13498/g.24851  ORF Transcript_13498/g.24851 Transcript_13498/m.24851 type:complete len:238 (+) Transcript_13498:165-878(+)